MALVGLFSSNQKPPGKVQSPSPESQSWSNNSCICITLRLVMRWPTLTDPICHSHPTCAINKKCRPYWLALHASPTQLKYIIMTMLELYDLGWSPEWASHPTRKCRIPILIYVCNLPTPTHNLSWSWLRMVDAVISFFSGQASLVGGAKWPSAFLPLLQLPFATCQSLTVIGPS